MTQITGTIDLTQIPQQQFDPQFELRVAVVRDGAVLGSTVLKPGKASEHLPFQVAFEPPLLPGARLPCPVRLVIGPNVGDLELQSLENVSHVLNLTPHDAKASVRTEAMSKRSAETKPVAAQIADINFGKVALPAELYLRWLILCRTYTIHGRVVCRKWVYDPKSRRWTFCDAPVPGATVEAYDVDCFLWWCFRDFIKSAVTDINGNFTITFRWCCLLWRPWLLRNWTVDPDLYTRIHEIFAAAKIPLPPVPPEPDPLFLQQLVANAAGSQRTALRSAAVPSIVDTSASAEVLRNILPQSADLAQLHIWPWFDWNDCAPDIVFRVTQHCGDQLRVIHSETNAQTRWNIPTSLNVTLLANDQACCLPVCNDPECPDCVKLTWVGCTPTDQIGTNAGPPDLRGYGYSGSSLDRPFYDTLRIRGGVGANVDYFKLQSSWNGGPWSDVPVPVLEGFSRRYWDGSNFIPAPGPAFTPIVKNGQTVMITRQHYEALHPAIPRFGGAVLWDDYDTLLYFDTYDYTLKTSRIPDGLYQLRLVGYAADSADKLIPSSERILPTCGEDTEETVYIRLDNQSQMPHIVPGIPCTPIHACIAEPDCYVRKVCVNEGRSDEHCISACEIIKLSATDTLTIHFTASCPTTAEDGHLGGYWLRAEYGLSQLFYIGTGLHGTFQPDPTFEVGPDYASALFQGAPRPHWHGGDYKVTLTGADFPECCAYLLHLRAWKRTTDGCTDPQYVHANEFEMAFTVLRPELCPDVCPDIQKKNL
jgi:hypothetical protein